MPDSELVLIVAARKIEGLPDDVSIDKSIDCIIGMCHPPPKYTHQKGKGKAVFGHSFPPHPLILLYLLI